MQGLPSKLSWVETRTTPSTAGTASAPTGAQAGERASAGARAPTANSNNSSNESSDRSHDTAGARPPKKKADTSEEESTSKKGKTKPSSVQERMHERSREASEQRAEQRDHDTTVEGGDERPAKKMRGRPPTRVLPDPRSERHYPGCSGCEGRSYYHSAMCRAYQAGLDKREKENATETKSSLKKEREGSSSSSSQTRADDVLLEEPQTKRVRFADDVNTAGHILQIGNEEYAVPEEKPEGQDSLNDHYDEDDGELLNPEDVKRGIERETKLLKDLEVYETIKRDSVPKNKRIWTGRWCHRKKDDSVRSRWVIRQYRNQVDQHGFAGTPGTACIRILLAICSLEGLEAMTGDFSVAFMHTPIHTDEYVQPPPEIEPDPNVVWKLKKALNGLVSAASEFQRYLTYILVSKLGFIAARARPTLFRHERSRLRTAIHVDDPLTTGPSEAITKFHE